TPAEAVLALMSAERIDPEQESVEQAGGDERAAVRRLSEEAESTVIGMVEYCLNARVCLGMDEGFKSFDPEEEHDFVKELREFVEGRAALAQPSPAQAEQAEGAHVPDEVFAGVFAEWWEEEGQYCRAGGGDYERTFAFQAWRHLYPLLLQARAALAQPSAALPPFAEKVLAKLRRFYDCASDFESGGVDIGRHWLDLLTQLGLLNRVQRSPALWEISQQGEDLLGAPQHFPARTEQANSGYDQLWAWFGLSRSAYAVLPRVMMHAMPDDWQRRFAELMDEWDDHWPNQPDINARVHITQNGLYISTPKWLLDYRHPDHNQLNAMRGKDEL
ncbi:hypothetical protein ACRCP5_00005, partial [Pseudomonas aeruginosa]